jgi:hypothetical protein
MSTYWSVYCPSHVYLSLLYEQLVASVPGLQHPGSASSSSASSSTTATPIPVAAAPAINAWGLPPPLPKHKQQQDDTTTVLPQQQQQQQTPLLQGVVGSSALNGTPISPPQQQQQQQSSLYPLQQSLPQLFTEDPPLLLQRSSSIGSSGVPATPPHSAIAGPSTSGINSVNISSTSSSSVALSLPMVSAAYIQLFSTTVYMQRLSTAVCIRRAISCAANLQCLIHLARACIWC